MARVKLTEYDAKRLLLPALGQNFSGFSATVTTTSKELTEYFGETNLVVKVDQGIKKRGKLGLVKVNLAPREVVATIKTWSPTWSHFFVEPVVEHSHDTEEYLVIERMRETWQISYAEKGGIEVEKNWDKVTHDIPTRLRHAIYDSLIPRLEKYHIVFLEMNPVLIRGEQIIPLDMAAEIDSAALGLPELGNASVVPVEDQGKSLSEKQIAELDASTPASLKFHLVNQEGHIWMLLSGGGASLVLADEVNDQGIGKELANYGEYSGAPTDDDVYAYTKIILSQLFQMKSAGPRAIIIAGGVANFTDVGKTFKGIIRAMEEVKEELVKAKVKVFVRRGGPSEVKGLAMMEKFLKGSNLFGSVHGHDVALTKVVTEVKEYL